MKSDEKASYEFKERLDCLAKSLCGEKEDVRASVTNLYDFILKTRREAVEEAFRAIEIAEWDTVDPYLDIIRVEGRNEAIDEINRKKEEFLMEK